MITSIIFWKSSPLRYVALLIDFLKVLVTRVVMHVVIVCYTPHFGPFILLVSYKKRTLLVLFWYFKSAIKLYPYLHFLLNLMRSLINIHVEIILFSLIFNSEIKFMQILTSYHKWFNFSTIASSLLIPCSFLIWLSL